MSLVASSAGRTAYYVMNCLLETDPKVLICHIDRVRSFLPRGSSLTDECHNNWCRLPFSPWHPLLPAPGQMVEKTIRSEALLKRLWLSKYKHLACRLALNTFGLSAEKQAKRSITLLYDKKSGSRLLTWEERSSTAAQGVAPGRVGLGGGQPAFYPGAWSPVIEVLSSSFTPSYTNARQK